MLVKYYVLIWVLGILAAALFYMTGNLSGFVSVLFGVFTVGAIFVGIIGLLPSVIAQKIESEIEGRRGKN